MDCSWILDGGLGTAPPIMRGAGDTGRITPAIPLVVFLLTSLWCLFLSRVSYLSVVPSRA
ncbi:uncharacterized protein SCHCODRAFT_02201679 [Schizophyllum commune H4-8]|uniref:uncharacterized protein n=1 Tax=Schizophyllum commune (strain H4-8 / FGSC 9210) TaxID=578458 RepID=UPI00215F41F5|nr:uncharacterized protein SCHCODRAFT_02201679 [Schizophyllum commune H4-8]KAI5896897.1 hypothetical protein SCHCODRAFT_02201679 [Schizophyllum commune H4-8]